uniref:V-type proton ATPase subunit G n=1 Tax=Ornithorhynchus anatinus TaxID=9258 RepID=A0A6I8N042_ORNAN
GGQRRAGPCLRAGPGGWGRLPGGAGGAGPGDPGGRRPDGAAGAARCRRPAPGGGGGGPGLGPDAPWTGKARRLKQAKEEAQMEVEHYRREREQEFQTKQQAAMGSQGNVSAEVEQGTRRQVQDMQSAQQRSRERVLARLLALVCDVRPQIHLNYRIAA